MRGTAVSMAHGRVPKAESDAWDLGWVITGTRSKGHTRTVECLCHAQVNATLEKVAAKP